MPEAPEATIEQQINSVLCDLFALFGKLKEEHATALVQARSDGRVEGAALTDFTEAYRAGYADGQALGHDHALKEFREAEALVNATMREIEAANPDPLDTRPVAIPDTCWVSPEPPTTQ